MKNFKNIAYIWILSSFIFVFSCDTFEPEPLEWIQDENLTNPKDSTALYMKNLFFAVYLDIPTLHYRLQESYLDAGTDNGVPTRDKGGNGSLENYRNGRLSPENIASLDGNAWKRSYDGIRNANLFLQKIEGYPSSTQLSAVDITEMKAEARAVRAYHYIELVKRWGGVPIVYDEVFGLDDDLNLPKQNIQQCVDYILSEISPDSANSCYTDLRDAFATLNSANTSHYGRINKGTVLGLLSRLQLYLASPLYNEDNDMAKWREAVKAAEAVISLNIYDLFGDFRKLFADKTSFPNKEILMIKQFGENSGVETNNAPTGYFDGSIKSKGLTSPSQNLVDAFLTKDGKMIDDPTSNYNPQDPYANRDPRLQYSIFHNGSRWLRRNVETYNGGLDRKGKPGLFETQTGYYLRKFSSLSEETQNYANVPHHYLIIRYAEILLNYAEALNEIDTQGNKAKIEDCIIRIRKRAGINAGSDSRYGLPATYTYIEMRDFIRNERRIELAFEDHRMWDIKRWKLAGDVMNKPIKGVIIEKQTDNSFIYNYVDVRKSVFEPKMYWYPIARAELKGNSKLEQNSGWNY